MSRGILSAQTITTHPREGTETRGFDHPEAGKQITTHPREGTETSHRTGTSSRFPDYNSSPRGDGNGACEQNNPVIIRLQLIPARGRKRVMRCGGAGLPLLQLIPARGRKRRTQRARSNCRSLQLIPARGRKPRWTMARHSGANYNSSPRGDGNDPQHTLATAASITTHPREGTETSPI